MKTHARYPSWLQRALKVKQQTETFWQQQPASELWSSVPRDDETSRDAAPVASKPEDDDLMTIWEAIRTDNASEVKRIVAQDSDILFQKGSREANTSSVFHEVAICGALDVIRFLISFLESRYPPETSQLIVDTIDSAYSQATPLIAACRSSQGDMKRRLEIVQLLVEAGSDVDHQDSHGDNVLHWCARLSHVMLLRYLLQETTAASEAVFTENFKREKPVDIAKRQLARRSCLSTMNTLALLRHVDHSVNIRLKMQVIKHEESLLLADASRQQHEQFQTAMAQCESALDQSRLLWENAIETATKRRQAAEDAATREAVETASQQALAWLAGKDGKSYIKARTPIATTEVKLAVQQGTRIKPKDTKKAILQHIQDIYCKEKQDEARSRALDRFRSLNPRNVRLRPLGFLSSKRSLSLEEAPSAADRIPVALRNVNMKAVDERHAEAKLKPLSQVNKVLRFDTKAPKYAAPKEEKRIAHHTADDMDPKAVRPSSGSTVLKESKLKQPEPIPKILEKQRSSGSPSLVAGSSSKAVVPDAKKVTVAPVETHQFSNIHPRAEGKQSDMSLHKVRSVQSLANEIRRIRSMTNEKDAQEPPVEKKLEKKSSNQRSKIKLEIAEPVFTDLSAAPDREQISSPTVHLRPTMTASPTATSAGKKGLNRNFAQGLGINFQLDLQQSAEHVDKSFDLSASGTFDAVGFQIKQSGITRSPDRSKSNQKAPLDAKKHLVKLGVLGRGASGVVHKALHVPSLLLVAVKVIPVFENEKRHQLIAELKALYNNLSTLSDDAADRKTVACPEIVCLYDAFMNPNEGNVSIVVEYMDGGSLQDIVERGGCKSESVLANISYRVLKGLAFLHGTHQLHRDIKPSNLLINHFGDVKISDFGIVREMENSMAKATTFVGTLTYMSPERIASEEYSYKSDVWSLGLSIMTCALGRFPYSSKGGYWELLHMIRNEPPPHLPSDEFSDLFRDFLDKCLKKDQAERWSVKQLLGHEFLKHCERQAASPINPPSEDEWTGAGSAEEDSKEQVEVDEIVQKVTEYYFKDAKELISDHGYTLPDIIAWIQLLPAMQKAKLDRFADQIGLSRRLVYSKFQLGMNDMLHDIEEKYLEEAKQAK